MCIYALYPCERQFWIYNLSIILIIFGRYKLKFKSQVIKNAGLCSVAHNN